MAKIDRSPIKVEAKNFRIDENGNLQVDISRELLVIELPENKQVERSTRREAADGVGEPKEGYLAEDVEFDIYFGGTKITEYTERFYYKVIDGSVEAQERFIPINVLLSRSTSQPCLDLTSNNIIGLTLYYDKNQNSPYNTKLYTQQVLDNVSPATFVWGGKDRNNNKFEWVNFPDTSGDTDFFYKVKHPPGDYDPDTKSFVYISNTNEDRKSCNITREVYPITLFLGPNYENNEDTTKAMVCSPVYSGRGVSFSRQTIEVYVLNNPNSEEFSLYQQVLYEEDGVTPIHPLQLNVFGSTRTNNFVVKLADDDVAPYYYLAESTVTTPLFKNTSCYRVGNQLGLCFDNSVQEEFSEQLTDCDIVDNNLRPGSEGGPPEDKITAVCRGDEYTWNGIKWYLNEN